MADLRSKIVSVLLILCNCITVWAQKPMVPERLVVAGVDLRINKAAQNELQDLVDQLTSSPMYFDNQVKKAAKYFPIIERILSEEKVPDDIKYLVIQESALTADAVSSSNAVGFWQFKDFTAVEMGLRVDHIVDERMNIVSSTRAAARYLKKNNFYFDNWIHAIQAYQMGPGGAMSVLADRDFGAKSMAITRKTYWYVKKFIAHKIAYEHGTSQDQASDIKLVEYSRGGSRTLKSIAQELDVDLHQLESYNLWARKGKVPDDKDYVVIVPVVAGKSLVSDQMIVETSGRNRKSIEPQFKGYEDPGKFPVISDKTGLFTRKSVYVMVNGIPGIEWKDDLDLAEVLVKADITEEDFRKYNEILPHQAMENGQVYYFKKKKSKAKAHFHTVSNSESLWEISQKYGVREKKILQKNRIEGEKEISPGLVLWVRFIRPAKQPVVVREVLVPPVVSTVSDRQEANPETPTRSKPAAPNDNSGMTANHRNESESVDAAGRVINSSEKLESKLIHHLIKPGETLYRIGDKYRVEVMDIAIWNNLNVRDGIKAGDKLRIFVDNDWDSLHREEYLNTDELKEGTYGNSGNQNNNIQVDQDLETKLMEPVDGSEQVVEYVTKAGDTLFGIASKFNVTIQQIQKWNDLENTRLSQGQVIKIVKPMD